MITEVLFDESVSVDRQEENTVCSSRNMLKVTGNGFYWCACLKDSGIYNWKTLSVYYLRIDKNMVCLPG